jgi:hypothetical protein
LYLPPTSAPIGSGSCAAAGMMVYAITRLLPLQRQF